MKDVYFNVSRLKTLAACPSEFYYRYGVQAFDDAPPGMVPMNMGTSAAAMFGTAVHAGLEEYVRDWGNVDAAKAKVREVLLDAIAEAEDTGQGRVAQRLKYGTGGPPRECGRCQGRGHSAVKKLVCGTCKGAGNFQPSTTEGIEYGMKMVEAYCKEYPLNDVDDDFRVVEKEIVMPLGTMHDYERDYAQVTYWLVGRLDRVIWKNGMLWHRNYKTMFAGVNLAGEMARYQQDPHEVAYWMLMKHHWPDARIGGSYIDGLVKQKEPQFHRLIVPHNDKVEAAIKHWLWDKMVAAHNLMKLGRGEGRLEVGRLQAEGVLGIEPKACVNPFGGRPCDYFEMCSGKQSVYPAALPGLGFTPRSADYIDDPTG